MRNKIESYGRLGNIEVLFKNMNNALKRLKAARQGNYIPIAMQRTCLKEREGFYSS